MSLLKHKLALLIIPILVVAGAAGAYAATQSSAGTSQQAFLNDVARRLHVTPQQLKNALAGAYSDQLSAAVAAGRLTKAQASAIERQLKRTGAIPLGGGFGFGAGRGFAGPNARFRPGLAPRPGAKSGSAIAPGWGPGSGWGPGGPAGGGAIAHGFGFGFGLLPQGLRAVTSYLGITAAKLQTDLRAGKSLAQIATAQGKTASGLESDITSVLKSMLSKQVAAKHLTQAQAQKLLATMKARIAAIVDRKFSNGARGGIRFGMHFHFGPPQKHGSAGTTSSQSKSSSGAISSLFAPA